MVPKWFMFLPMIICLASGISGPLVETRVGPIRGLIGDGYSMFLGIPYATAEENPFGPSKPYPKFEGEFEAYNDSAICPQIGEFNLTVTGTLDCLHLNIYVPDSATPSNKLPVLVWIHGGGFAFGFSGRYVYGPKYLIRHDIILVTLNYRLGPYGFMCLNTPEVPGNAGLKDQKIALEWIKDNIESFNGDPDKITIYGMSAGGMSVNLHYMFGNHSLFDKLIMHSGTALTPKIFGKPDVKAALKLAKELGLETTDNNEALKFLSTVDPIKVITSNQALHLSYGLCVEEDFEGVERYVNEHPYNVIGPDASNIPVLLAYNRDEIQIVYALMPAEHFGTLSDIFVNDLTNYFNFNTTQLQSVARIVKHFYMGDESFTEKIRWNLGKYNSDLVYIYPTIRSIKRFVDYGSTNVYHFVFSYDGGRNYIKSRTNLTHLDMAVHADDIGYLFDASYMTTPSEKDQLVIDRMTTLWANFVKYGNPTPQPTELLPVTWEPATEDTIPYLELDSEVHVGKRHYHDRVAFWDLFYAMNWEAQKGLNSKSI